MDDIPEATAMAEAAVRADVERAKPPGPLRIQINPLVKQKEPAE